MVVWLDIKLAWLQRVLTRLKVWTISIDLLLLWKLLLYIYFSILQQLIVGRSIRWISIMCFCMVISRRNFICGRRMGIILLLRIKSVYFADRFMALNRLLGNGTRSLPLSLLNLGSCSPSTITVCLLGVRLGFSLSSSSMLMMYCLLDLVMY